MSFFTFFLIFYRFLYIYSLNPIYLDQNQLIEGNGTLSAPYKSIENAYINLQACLSASLILLNDYEFQYINENMVFENILQEIRYFLIFHINTLIFYSIKSLNVVFKLNLTNFANIVIVNSTVTFQNIALYFGSESGFSSFIQLSLGAFLYLQV